jgi:hypothetical protein
MPMLAKARLECTITYVLGVWGGGLMVPVVSSDDVPGWSATGVGALRGLFATGSAAASGS